MPDETERQHWVWVTRPEYYLDDSGDERTDFDPGNEPADSWWTCHPDTRAGDLVLLYRTTPKRDFPYVFEAASDARSFDDDRPPGSLTIDQMDALVEAVSPQHADLTQLRSKLEDFEERHDALNEAQERLYGDADAYLERFPGYLGNPVGLPLEARKLRLDYDRRWQEIVDRGRLLDAEEWEFLGVAPLPDDLDTVTEEGFEQWFEHRQLVQEARASKWKAFHTEVLLRSGHLEDTLLWDPGEFAGAYVCEWKSRVKLETPLPLSSVRADPRLQEWNALRASFQKRVWPADEQWETLIELADAYNPGLVDTLSGLELRRVSPDIVSERELEDALAGPGLAAIDPNLELIGRQYRLAPYPWAIDLLCRDRNGGAYVVVELKVVKATEVAHAQVARYVGWVREHLAAPGTSIRGIVVSDGYDDRFKYAIAASDDFVHMQLSEVRERLAAASLT